MIEEAKVNFYAINRCGYYKYGNQEQEFSDVADMLSELQAWVAGKELGETCTFDVEEGDYSRTFCYDVAKHSNGDYLLITWNESPSTEGHIASVSPHAPVGGADVEMTELPAGYIPGFATYFWFIPEHNVLATVRFQHVQNGHRNLNIYIKEFLAKFTRYVVSEYNDESDECEIAGYRRSSKEIITKLFPQFRSSRYRKPGQIEFIQENCHNIRKIVQKNLLSPYVKAPDLSFIHRLFRRFHGLDKLDGTQEEVRFKYEIEYSPTPDELGHIIETWTENENNEESTKWDDIGFQFINDSETYWLSHSSVRDEIEIDVKRDNEEVVNAASLLNALHGRRRHLLKILQGS
jgi:hypothetical protein